MAVQTWHITQSPPPSDLYLTGSLIITHKAENVTKALVRAVTAEKHRPQHVVGMDGRFFMVPVMMLPRRCVLVRGGGVHRVRIGRSVAGGCAHIQHKRAQCRLINSFYDGGTFGKTKPAGALEEKKSR